MLTCTPVTLDRSVFVGCTCQLVRISINMHQPYRSVHCVCVCACVRVCVRACVCVHVCIFCIVMLEPFSTFCVSFFFFFIYHNTFLLLRTFLSQCILCVILGLFRALSCRVGDLQISIITIIASLHCELINPLHHCIVN